MTGNTEQLTACLLCLYTSLKFTVFFHYKRGHFPFKPAICCRAYPRQFTVAEVTAVEELPFPAQPPPPKNAGAAFSGYVAGL